MTHNLSSIDQLNLSAELNELVAPQPTVIGLEGGPCSGKTTLTEAIEARAEYSDRPFMALPEAATIHLNRLAETGRSVVELATEDRPAYLRFQADVLTTIFTNIEQAKAKHEGSDAVILVDRPDIGAYVKPEEYRQVLAMVGHNRSPIQSVVDKLVYLPSVASVQPERYGALRGTNGARYETSAAQAAAVCAATLQAVRTHPELHVAWGGEFKESIKYLADIVLDPEREGEIKFSVPNTAAEAYVEAAASKGNLLNVIKIEQSYHNFDGLAFRLRRSVGEDGQEYRHFTMKLNETGLFCREVQRSLDEAQYDLLKRARQLGRRALAKERHVILDEPDENGKRRLWYADRYKDPTLDEWHFETDVYDEYEAAELLLAYRGARRHIADSSKELIFK